MGGVVWARFLLGFAAIWGVLFFTSEIDATGRIGLFILGATVVAAALVEVFLWKVPIGDVLNQLGYGMPSLRSVVVAAVVGVAVLGVYPLFTLVTGRVVALRPGWPWLLLGLFAFHGLAEELAWRGYTFRRLSFGRSFWGAMLWTMVLLAATHVPILATAGALVGMFAILIAAITSIPLGHLYEMGRRTIWGPAVVHTAIDTFKLVEVPTEVATTFSMLLGAVSIVIPLAVLLVPRRGRLQENG